MGSSSSANPSSNVHGSGQAALWANTKFTNDSDGKMAEKFRRLMGCKSGGWFKFLFKILILSLKEFFHTIKYLLVKKISFKITVNYFIVI